jgi:hypothetical protein
MVLLLQIRHKNYLQVKKMTRFVVLFQYTIRKDYQKTDSKQCTKAFHRFN